MDIVVAPKRYTHRQAGTRSVPKNGTKTMQSVSGAITTELKHAVRPQQTQAPHLRYTSSHQSTCRSLWSSQLHL